MPARPHRRPGTLDHANPTDITGKLIMGSFETRRRRSRVLLATGATLIAVAALIAVFAGAAHATAAQTPGSPCTAAGATFTRHGHTYECVQKPWDDCLRWHDQKPAGYHPPPSWTRPAQRPCTTCTPSPSTPASPSIPAPTTPPATTPAASPAPSSPAALPHPTDSATPPLDELPVTGPPAGWLAVAGLVLVAAGLMLRFYRRSISGSDPHRPAAG